MAKQNGSKKRSISQSWRYNIVKRIKIDPESRARERLRESFSERLQRQATERNLMKITVKRIVKLILDAPLPGEKHETFLVPFRDIAGT